MRNPVVLPSVQSHILDHILESNVDNLGQHLAFLFQRKMFHRLRFDNNLLLHTLARSDDGIALSVGI